MSEDGFIMLSRRAFQHFLWREERQKTRWEAWVDLIQLAAFSPNKMLVGDRRLNLARGELVASVRYLATRWSWDKCRVSRFIALLREEEMIETRNETGITIVRLCKYDQYNSSHGRNETTDETAARQQRDKEEERKEDSLAREDGIDRPGSEPEMEVWVSACARSLIPRWFAEDKWRHYSGRAWHSGKTPIVWKKQIATVKQDFENEGRPMTRPAGLASVGNRAAGGEKLPAAFAVPMQPPPRRPNEC